MNKLYKNWFVHNIIAHPLMYFSGLVNKNLADRIHDVTIPDGNKTVDISKYQQTAQRILNLEDNFKLEMHRYCSSPFLDASPECGTSFCLLGILAYQDNYPRKFRIHDIFFYEKYLEELIGFKSGSDEWSFLFDASWSNSLEHAKKRAQYVLDNDDYPKNFDLTWES